MKRKTIYSLILICCLGLLSSANQNDKKCAKETCCFSAKVNCCPGTPLGGLAEKNDSQTVPLSLFLFDL